VHSMETVGVKALKELPSLPQLPKARHSTLSYCKEQRENSKGPPGGWD
jgi:hypothetical protein